MKQFCLLIGLVVFSLLGGYYSYAAELPVEESTVSAVESMLEYPVAVGVARDQALQAEPVKQVQPQTQSSSSMVEFVILVLIAIGSFLASVLLLLRYRKLKEENNDTAK